MQQFPLICIWDWDDLKTAGWLTVLAQVSHQTPGSGLRVVETILHPDGCHKAE